VIQCLLALLSSLANPSIGSSFKEEHARQPIESGVEGRGKRIFQIAMLADIASRIDHTALIGNDWIEP